MRDQRNNSSLFTAKQSSKHTLHLSLKTGFQPTQRKAHAYFFDASAADEAEKYATNARNTRLTQATQEPKRNDMNDVYFAMRVGSGEDRALLRLVADLTANKLYGRLYTISRQEISNK